MVVSTAASTSKEGEEVFSESRSLVFKSLKVRRVIDEPGQSVVYAVFSQRLDKKEDSNNSRFKSNLCAVSCLFEPVDADVGAPTSAMCRRRFTWTSLRKPQRRSKRRRVAGCVECATQLLRKTGPVRACAPVHILYSYSL